MVDYLSRACRLQLTTAVENLIRTAVFDISQIFEDSLHDHQVELARKGEEIAFLKVKLQRAELRLKEVSSGSGTEQSLNQSFELPKINEETAPFEPVPLESSPVPAESYEFEEVPDDWCVPLELETVIKPENPCPSVRLRQFSIPLQPISLKHEAFSRLEVPRVRHRRNRDTTKKGSQEIKQHKRKHDRPRVMKKPQVKEVIMNIKEEPVDFDGVETFKRGRGRPKGLTKRKMVITNMNETGSSGTIYICRFCPKIFDSQSGLGAHERAHKTCKGCKKIFPYPSGLAIHKCRYIKDLESSIVSSQETLSKNQTITKEKTILKEEPISKEEISNMEQKYLIGKPKIKFTGRKINRFTCKCCRKKFINRSELIRHPCFITCQLCHKRLSTRVALALHMAKVHQGPTEGRTAKVHKGPTEERTAKVHQGSTEERTAKVHKGPTKERTAKVHKGPIKERMAKVHKSPTEERTAKVHKRLTEERTAKVHKGPTEERTDTSWTKPLVKMDKKAECPFEKAKLKVKQCPLGFKCLVCKRVYSSKYSAIEHMFIHTGDKPFKCNLCSEEFGHSSYLSFHRRKVHGVRMRKFLICACSQRFYLNSKFKEHKLKCPKVNKR